MCAVYCADNLWNALTCLKRLSDLSPCFRLIKSGKPGCQGKQKGELSNDSDLQQAMIAVRDSLDGPLPESSQYGIDKAARGLVGRLFANAEYMANGHVS